MTKHIIHLTSLISIFKCFSAFAQLNEANLITWTKDYLLTYDDFNGSPGKEAEVALTSSGFLFSYQYDGKSQLTIEVTATFDKSKSWFRDEGKTNEVLNHEQTHFNITEVNARLLRKAFFERTYKSSNNFDVLLTRLYDDFTDRCSRMQNEYDNETNHGINSRLQQAWDKKISQQLKELEKHSPTQLNLIVN